MRWARTKRWEREIYILKGWNYVSSIYQEARPISCSKSLNKSIPESTIDTPSRSHSSILVLMQTTHSQKFCRFKIIWIYRLMRAAERVLISPPSKSTWIGWRIPSSPRDHFNRLLIWILLLLGIQSDLVLRISNTRKNSTQDQITRVSSRSTTIIR